MTHPFNILAWLNPPSPPPPPPANAQAHAVTCPECGSPAVVWLDAEGQLQGRCPLLRCWPWSRASEATVREQIQQSQADRTARSVPTDGRVA